MTYPSEDDTTIGTQEIHNDAPNANTTKHTGNNKHNSNDNINLFKKVTEPSSSPNNDIITLKIGSTNSTDYKSSPTQRKIEVSTTTFIFKIKQPPPLP